MKLNELKKWFKENDNKIIDNIRLNSGEIVCLGKLFVESHISILEHNSGDKLFIPYYSRLYNYYLIISKV